MAGRNTGLLAGNHAAGTAELSWVWTHWEDVLSDLSVFHRVDDPGRLTIRRFRSLALRLPAYAGALRAALGAQTAEVASAAGTPARPVSPPVGGSGGDTPPELLAQLKRQQFAQRHGADASAIEWDNDAIYRELVNG